VERLRRYN